MYILSIFNAVPMAKMAALQFIGISYYRFFSAQLEGFFDELIKLIARVIFRNLESKLKNVLDILLLTLQESLGYSVLANVII